MTMDQPEQEGKDVLKGARAGQHPWQMNRHSRGPW